MRKIDELRERLRRYREAEAAILSAQSYSVDGMMLTRADLKTVQGMIESLSRQIYRLERELGLSPPRSRMRVVIPADGMRFVRP